VTGFLTVPLFTISVPRWMQTHFLETGHNHTLPNPYVNTSSSHFTQHRKFDSAAK